jgi:hypothetical protein
MRTAAQQHDHAPLMALRGLALGVPISVALWAIMFQGLFQLI